MKTSKFQPKHADNKSQYLQMLKDGIVGENKAMTREQYLYEIEEHIIYQGSEFVVYKWYGNEFFISKSIDDTGEFAFYLNEIDKTKVFVNADGKIEVSWDNDSTWPSVFEYIEKDGFPINFKLFKDYGSE